jgi:hypothetical protein
MLLRKILIPILCALTVVVWAQAPVPVAAPQPVWPGEVAAPPAPAGAVNPQDQLAVRNLINTLRNAAVLPAVITAGPKYVYLLRNGMVAQYDGLAPQPVKQLQLYGPLPAPPAADAPLADRVKYGLQVGKRMAVATMLLHGDDLLVVTNDTVFCVDALTLKTKTTTSLTLADQPQPPIRYQMAISNAPTVQVAGHVAYILQGNDQLIAVDLLAGTVLGRGKLPDAMTPPTLNALFANELNGGGDPWANGGPGVGRVQPVVEGGVNLPKTITLIGTVRHVNLEGGFWAFDDRNGQKYALTGDKLKDLIATPNIEGARVRITGAISANPGIAMYGNGAFTVTDFQVMPAVVQ